MVIESEIYFDNSGKKNPDQGMAMFRFVFLNIKDLKLKNRSLTMS
jgi:hypothetical protein